MKRKWGMVASCMKGETELNALRHIKDYGFESFFSTDNPSDCKHAVALKNEAVKLGLEYEFIHGPFDGINDMWTSTEEPQIFRDFKASIDAAKESGAKAVVTHVSSSFNPPQINAVGLSRFDQWVEYAEKQGVVLAFENLRRLGNFAYLMDRYEGNPFVKYCYDSGHEHCYTVTAPFARIYGDRLFCTHLHDNFGQNKAVKDGGDSHLLPFDGNIDFDEVAKNLAKSGYKGSLMLEVFSGIYPNLTTDEFMKTAYERAQKLLKLVEKYEE